MDEFKRTFLGFASHVICFGLSLDLLYIIIRAYLNGYSITVYINNYGEANLELILIPVTLLFCLVGLWFAWRNLKKYLLKIK